MSEKKINKSERKLNHCKKILIKVANGMELTDQEKKWLKVNIRKRCGKCEELKKTEEFSNLTGGRFGVSAWCKKCVALHSKKVYNRKKEESDSESESEEETRPKKKDKINKKNKKE